MTGHAPFAVIGYLCLAAIMAGAIGVVWGFGVLVGLL
jgi:hypothetical protein